jgi:hypothetical protein
MEPPSHLRENPNESYRNRDKLWPDEQFRFDNSPADFSFFNQGVGLITSPNTIMNNVENKKSNGMISYQ